MFLGSLSVEILSGFGFKVFFKIFLYFPRTLELPLLGSKLY